MAMPLFTYKRNTNYANQWRGQGDTNYELRKNTVGSGNEGTPPDTSVFSPHAVAGLFVTIGRYWSLFKCLTAVSVGRSYRFEHKVRRSCAREPSPGSREEVRRRLSRRSR